MADAQSLSSLTKVLQDSLVTRSRIEMIYTIKPQIILLAENTIPP